MIGVVENKPLQPARRRHDGELLPVYGRTRTSSSSASSANDVPGGLAAIDALWKRLSPKTSRSIASSWTTSSIKNYENFARISQVFAGLAFLAVVISVIGLFGMAVQVASRRVHEIGVRKSVGARTGQMVAMLLRSFSKPVVIANLLAWPLGYLAAQQYLSIFIQRIP